MAAHATRDIAGEVRCRRRDWLVEVDDSFGKFLFGIYRKFKREYYRSYGEGVKETADASVWRRWQETGEYRPQSLCRHPDCPAAPAAAGIAVDPA